MQTKLFTGGLLVLALTSGALAFLHFTEKNLALFFGEAPISEGRLLFEFAPQEIRDIALEATGKPQSYQKRQGQWLLGKGSGLDRADYRKLEALSTFSASLTVLESFPASEENRKAMGFSPSRAHIRFQDLGGNAVADYALGSQGAWQRFVPAADQFSQPQNWPSVYVWPREGKTIYLCSSPFLEDVLANGFESARDLRPFFFPPEMLAEVTIARPNGRLVVARASPTAEWVIEKPFRLDTDSEAVARLVGGLYKLTALSAENKPAPTMSEALLELSLRFFSLDGTVQEIPVTLALTETSRGEETYFGRLNDWRQSIEFELPRQSTRGLLGVDELPLDIEDLRGASLSGIDLRNLKKLVFQSPELTGAMEIEITKSPISGEWQAVRHYGGATVKANEMTFFTVKRTLTEGKAIATISDSVSDLAEYGLEEPALSLRMELFDGGGEVLHFGEVISREGVPHYYFRRGESRTVMEVAPQTYYQIAARPYLWRDGVIWNFTPLDLSLLRLDQEGSEPLTLRYSDLTQTWVARLGEEDVTALLNENRANRYLETLEGLRVTRWLEAGHEPALRALQSPELTLTAIFQKPDDSEAPLETKVLRLARVGQGAQDPFFFGQVEGDAYPFLLDTETMTKLREPLIERD